MPSSAVNSAPLRLIYIHGYVEDPSIFDNLIPLLPADNVLNLNLQDEFAHWNPDDKTVNVSSLAAYLAKNHQITAADVVIGHSMGGYIAANLKAQTGCGAVLISSYTDPAKVITPIRSVGLLKYLVNWGVIQSSGFANYALKKYPFDQSRTLHKGLIGNMVAQPKRFIYQQLRVLMAKPDVPPAPADVRIHTRPDNVLRYPDEPFHETPGDHFNLVYHPEEVAAPILAYLATRVQAGV
ncbi:alpha/beta hydrolase [Fibrella sp. HMF5335]|uniref:Alpha/beta hydrolase n=1 Tax=Fibrella rubiginis TaxID=2817060 RepID=A0A939GIF4_9BACT|nr:alpha/beta hydrolase [Fibrella rubiginis]MBO0937814.1 alpha/beta hydrolase [Fibrella rubiginis]